MNKRYLPFAVFPSIYAIPLAFYRENGITTILCDLDNTLDSYREKEPGPAATALVKSLAQEGITLFIASNNTSTRVAHYSEKLGVKAFSGLCKPCGKRLRKLMASEGFDPAKTVLVGDQVLTDVAGGNKAHLRTILTEPLTPHDQLFTKVNRLLEKPLRAKISALFAERKEAS